MEINFRQATHLDLDYLIRLFIDTITNINIRDYTNEQIQAWITGHDREERWGSKISKQFFLVAEQNDTIVGFGSITQSGYLDLLFVHKDHQRKGIAQALFDQLLLFAEKASCASITTDASKSALPFFEKNHFRIVSQRDFMRNDVAMTNFKMERTI